MLPIQLLTTRQLQNDLETKYLYQWKKNYCSHTFKHLFERILRLSLVYYAFGKVRRRKNWKVFVRAMDYIKVVLMFPPPKKHQILVAIKIGRKIFTKKKKLMSYSLSQMWLHSSDANLFDRRLSSMPTKSRYINSNPRTFSRYLVVIYSFLFYFRYQFYVEFYFRVSGHPQH